MKGTAVNQRTMMQGLGDAVKKNVADPASTAAMLYQSLASAAANGTASNAVVASLIASPWRSSASSNSDVLEFLVKQELQ
jgi:hypothetical protein